MNTATGDYMFCCRGQTITGKATLTKKGCIVTISHNPPTMRVLITYDGCLKNGKASLQMPPGTNMCNITDRNTADSMVRPCSVAP